MTMKDFISSGGILILIFPVVCIFLILCRDYKISQKNDSVTQVTFERSHPDIQEIPNNDVGVVYFRDPATDLCYALLAGVVSLKPRYLQGFGNVVVVSCNKVMSSSVTGER